MDEQRTPEQIRDALIDSLSSAGAAEGTAAGQLLAHLEASKAGSPVDHSQTLVAYGAACQSRDVAELVRDGLKLRSLQRQIAFPNDGKLDTADGLGIHPFAVFEFEQTMPVDNIRVSASAQPDDVEQVQLSARFSPIDCTLVDEFVPGHAASG